MDLSNFNVQSKGLRAFGIASSLLVGAALLLVGVLNERPWIREKAWDKDGGDTNAGTKIISMKEMIR